MIIIAWQNCYV